MDEQNNIVPREHANGGAIEPVSTHARFLTLEMMPREPHLLDYLLILRKHQWLIVSFLLAVVTIVTIGTFRTQPVYEATTRIEIDRENTSILSFTGHDPQYEAYEDLDTYIETQSKILTSATLAQQTINRSIWIRTRALAARPRIPASLKSSRPPRAHNRPLRRWARFWAD